MAELTLLPDPTCLHLHQLEAEGKVITVPMKTTAGAVRCPLCESRGEQVHSKYVRPLEFQNLHAAHKYRPAA